MYIHNNNVLCVQNYKVRRIPLFTCQSLYRLLLLFQLYNSVTLLLPRYYCDRSDIDFYHICYAVKYPRRPYMRM